MISECIQIKNPLQDIHLLPLPFFMVSFAIIIVVPVLVLCTVVKDVTVFLDGVVASITVDVVGNFELIELVV